MLTQVQVYGSQVIEAPYDLSRATVSIRILAPPPEVTQNFFQPSASSCDCCRLPGSTQHLLDIHASFEDFIGLPGEPLGVTNKSFHNIALKHDTQLVYVPAYQLPHSHRKLIDGMVKEMLHQGVIDESFSPVSRIQESWYLASCNSFQNR